MEIFYKKARGFAITAAVRSDKTNSEKNGEIQSRTVILNIVDRARLYQFNRDRIATIVCCSYR
jgi:hypothetical protein